MVCGAYKFYFVSNIVVWTSKNNEIKTVWEQAAAAGGGLWCTYYVPEVLVVDDNAVIFKIGGEI